MLYIEPKQREAIRVSFFRKHCSQSALSSVAVRRDPQEGVWFLDVAITRDMPVDGVYMGLQVRTRTTARAVNAVAPSDQAA